MAQRWFFNVEGENIEMVCRAEGPGVTGDAYETLTPEDEVKYPDAYPYAELRKAGGGVLEVGEGRSMKVIPNGD